MESGVLSLLQIILSNSFPAVSSMHSDLYENGSSGGLFSFGISTRSRCFFQGFENVTSHKHAEYTSQNRSCLISTAVLRTVFGKPFSRVAFSGFIRGLASNNSSIVTGGISSLIWFCWTNASSYCGKRVSTILRMILGQVRAFVLLILVFYNNFVRRSPWIVLELC